jgi:hypothetical protein
MAKVTKGKLSTVDGAFEAPTVASFSASGLGTGFTLPPALLAAVLLRRQREPLTYVSQKELDNVRDDEFQVTDHKNGHYTVKVLPRKGVKV